MAIICRRRNVRATRLAVYWMLAVTLLVASVGAVFALSLKQGLERAASDLEAKLLLQSLRSGLSYDLLSGNFVLASSRIQGLLKGPIAGSACVEIRDPNQVVTLTGGELQICADRGARHLSEWVHYDPELRNPAFEVRVYYSVRPISLSLPLWTWVSVTSLLGLFLISMVAFVRIFGGIFGRINLVIQNRDPDVARERWPSLEEEESIREAIRKLNSTDAELLETKLEKQRADVERKIARQVAHDIRSPIAALNALEQDLDGDRRQLLRAALSRIKSIASGLAAKSPAVESRRPTGEEPLRLIASEIISEKRAQYRSFEGLRLELESMNGTTPIFLGVDGVELRRALSNLIDNAAEALNYNGKIQIRIQQDNRRARIEVSDNGPGIAKELLGKLGSPGVSYGKPGGSGLGLAHAKEFALNSGGDFSIRSQVGLGTQVSVTLPIASAPKWLAPDLQIPEGHWIIVLDDDESIHEFWKSRLGSLSVPPSKLYCFKAAQELRAWLDDDSQRGGAPWRGRAVFLIDQDLDGDELKGLELIRNLGIVRSSTLVTNQFEDTRLREQCIALGLRIVPKGFASAIPVAMV